VPAIAGQDGATPARLEQAFYWPTPRHADGFTLSISRLEGVTLKIRFANSCFRMFESPRQRLVV